MTDLTQPVTNLTLGELQSIIRHMIQEEIGIQPWYQQSSDQGIENILDEMWHDLWTPPANAKSSLELLREDRG